MAGGRNGPGPASVTPVSAAAAAAGSARRDLRMARPTGLQARPPAPPDIETALQGLRGEVAGAPKPMPQAPAAGMPNGLPPRLAALAGRDPMAAAARFADFQAGRLPAQVAGLVGRSVNKPLNGMPGAGAPIGVEPGSEGRGGSLGSPGAQRGLPGGPPSAEGEKPLGRPGGAPGMIERLPGPGPSLGASGPVSINGGGLQAGPPQNMLDRVPPAVRERIAAMVADGGPAPGGGATNFGPPMSPYAATGNQGGGAMPGAPSAVDLPGMGARGEVPGGGFTPGGMPAGADQPYAVPPEVGGMAGSPQFASGGGLQGVPAPPQFDPWTSPPPGQGGGFNPQRFGGTGGGYRQLVQSRMYG